MTTSCSQCGAAITDRNAFCTKCGARRSQAGESGAARRFCTKCGTPLVGETKFCTKCGAVAGVTPSIPAPTATSGGDSVAKTAATVSSSATTGAAAQPAASAAPAAKSPGGIPKIALIAGGIVVLVLIVAAVAGMISAARRAREKAQEMEAKQNFAKSLANLTSAGNTASKNGNSPSAADINKAVNGLAAAANELAQKANGASPADINKALNQVASAANSGTAGSNGSLTSEEISKKLAANDPATVANAIWQNRDKPVSAIPQSALPAGVSVSSSAPGSYTWKQGNTTYTWDSHGLRQDYYPHGTYLNRGCPFPKAVPADFAPIVPAAATGNQTRNWALKYERTVAGPEADLVVRTGDINNLGFGWPTGFDPFSGQSTPPHSFPWKAPVDEPAGTDRIEVGSVLTANDPLSYSHGGDGYSGVISNCSCDPNFPPCQGRLDSMPQAIRLEVGALPAKISNVVFQIFADDFQSPVYQSHFQVSLNGTRIPTFEYAINSLNQTGPIGKLLTLRLLPEYWPLLKSREVKLLIDDPTTHVRDGYAVDFVRILVNPHKFKYEVSLTATVTDADTHKPITGATVTAALRTAATDRQGKCQLKGIPAGLVVATANAPGYDENSVPVGLPVGQTGNADIQLHRHQESTAALEQSIAQTGTATIYGIHFDTGSSKLRADSLPALQAVLGLINDRPGSNWIIAGHTDNQGSDKINIPLSKARAASVVSWLTGHDVAANRLEPQGFGSTRPVADNATASGRALNRRVEVSLAK